MLHTFNLGTHIWFVIHVENGQIVLLEEHDYREGGMVRKPPEMSYKEFFLKLVGERISRIDCERNAILKSAEKFLDSCLLN